MKNVLFLFILLSCSCSLMKVGSSLSEPTIFNEKKSFSVLGNLRVEVEYGEYKYDKIMQAAISKFGDGVDVINIKEDKAAKHFGVQFGAAKTIINCIVIRYNIENPD